MSAISDGSYWVLITPVSLIIACEVIVMMKNSFAKGRKSRSFGVQIDCLQIDVHLNGVWEAKQGLVRV